MCIECRPVGPLENGLQPCSASLAAKGFLRYANRTKLTRSGALDDLRRH
jgi:hypothetical protein